VAQTNKQTSFVLGIVTESVVERMSRYAQAASVRLRNIATIFLQDFAPHALPSSVPISQSSQAQSLNTLPINNNNNNNNNNNK